MVAALGYTRALVLLCVPSTTSAPYRSRGTMSGNRPAGLTSVLVGLIPLAGGGGGGGGSQKVSQTIRKAQTKHKRWNRKTPAKVAPSLICRPPVCNGARLTKRFSTTNKHEVSSCDWIEVQARGGPLRVKNPWRIARSAEGGDHYSEGKGSLLQGFTAMMQRGLAWNWRTGTLCVFISFFFICQLPTVQ